VTGAKSSGSDLGSEPQARQGWVAPHIAAEFPGLGIAWVELESKRAKSPEPVRRRLRDLSDRFYGSHAIHMRERPIPWAYRVFFRQIGLDPDHTRTPVEQLALNRLHDGAFVSHGMPADALTIATVETGVALRVFDTTRRRVAYALPGGAAKLPQGTLTIADGRSPLELLFGGRAADRELDSDAAQIAIVAVQVKGVPQAAVDEALWIAGAAIAA
jgi:hypothetical protein